MSSFQLGGHYLRSALFLAHASYVAYEENPESYKDFQNFHFDNVIPFASEKSKDNEATRGFLAERGDEIVLAFRGTDTNEGILEDWAINLKCLQIQDNGANVHKGFIQALNSVWNKINEPLEKMVEQKKRRIWITGHSLGGALATLATRRLLLNEQMKQIETYTFGQPMVGNKAMCQQTISPFSTFYRFAYASDPVTFVPFRVPKVMDYTHAGTPKLIDATGRVHEDASNWFTRLFVGYKTIKQITNDLFGNDLRTFVHKRIKDHLLPNYVEKIAQAIQNG